MAAQILHGWLRACRGPDVGREPLLACDFADGLNQRVGHPGAGPQGGFNLTDLDAEAADLHLLIEAPEILDVAVGPSSGQVARAIEPRTRPAVEWVSNEALGSEARLIEIAPGQPRPTDVQFAGDAHGHRLAAGVEKVQLQVGDGPADHAATAGSQVSATHWPVGDVDGRLGDAVHVDEQRLAVAVPLVPRAQALKVEGFAAEDHVAQRRGVGQWVAGFRLDQLPKRRWRLVEHRHALVAEQAAERRGRSAHQVWHDDKPPAVEQSAPQFPDGKVECVGVEERPHVAIVEAEPCVGRGKQADHVLMAHHCALGLSRRAGGVDDIGRIAGPGRRGQVGGGFRGDLRPIAIEAKDAGGTVGQMPQE